MNTVLVQEMERYNTYGKAAQFGSFKHASRTPVDVKFFYFVSG